MIDLSNSLSTTDTREENESPIMQMPELQLVQELSNQLKGNIFINILIFFLNQINPHMHFNPQQGNTLNQHQWTNILINFITKIYI